MKQKISEEEAQELYNEMLDDTHETLFGLLPSRILEECDPIQYNCGLTDYIDSLTDDYIIEGYNDDDEEED